MTQKGNHQQHNQHNQDKPAKALPVTPIFAAQGTTLLGIKINRPITKIAKKKFLQHCHNEAAIIISALLLGYLQWRDNNNSGVSFTSLATDEKQQKLEQTLIDKLKSFHQFPLETPEDPPPTPQASALEIPDNIRQQDLSLCGSLFDTKAKTNSHYIGEQLFMLTSELDPLIPKRWRPLFIHHHNAPWGWPQDKEENNHQIRDLPPKGFGPLVPFPDSKQQIIGIVYGCCLAHHLRETQPNITQLTAYEWHCKQPSETPSWCLGSAFYLSALGYLCPTIHLNSTPSWIAPRQSLLPASLNLDPRLLTSMPSEFQYQLFKSHMHNWMMLGLKLLNKKTYRKKLKNIARTAKGKMIIPLMLKKLSTTISDESITPLLDASLLFEDALTLNLSTSALLNQVLSKIKP